MSGDSGARRPCGARPRQAQSPSRDSGGHPGHLLGGHRGSSGSRSARAVRRGGRFPHQRRHQQLAGRLAAPVGRRELHVHPEVGDVLGSSRTRPSRWSRPRSASWCSGRWRRWRCPSTSSRAGSSSTPCSCRAFCSRSAWARCRSTCCCSGLACSTTSSAWRSREAAFGLPLTMLILRPFLRAIPSELQDAALGRGQPVPVLRADPDPAGQACPDHGRAAGVREQLEPVPAAAAGAETRRTSPCRSAPTRSTQYSQNDAGFWRSRRWRWCPRWCCSCSPSGTSSRACRRGEGVAVLLAGVWRSPVGVRGG